MAQIVLEKDFSFQAARKRNCERWGTVWNGMGGRRIGVLVTFTSPQRQRLYDFCNLFV